MKKALVFVSLLAITLSSFSQKSYNVMGWKVSKEKSYLQNELKVNLPMTIFASYPEISYERILNTDISVGASLGGSLNADRYPFKFAFTPYFRWFFGGNNKSLDRAGCGFFIETNASVYNQDMAEFSYSGSNDVSHRESKMGAGMGLAIGWKYLSNNNWVGEVYGGGGRNFIKNDYDVQAYPRFGISIGKRF